MLWYALKIGFCVEIQWGQDIGIYAVPFSDFSTVVRLAKHFSEENNDSMAIDIPQILSLETKLRLPPTLPLHYRITKAQFGKICCLINLPDKTALLSITDK